MKGFIFLISFLSVVTQLGYSEEEPWRYEWRDRSLEVIDSINQNSDIETVLRVGRLAILGRKEAIYSPLNAEVGLAAKNKLLSLPNHTSYFREELERAMELEYEYVRGTRGNSFSSMRYNVYSTLVHLPSPSVVELLGEMLDDDRDPWKGWPPSDTKPPKPNYYFACKTLNGIGLVGAPIDEDMGNEAKIQAVRHTWQLWYAQVKSGARTIRFEGDPQEYSLNGPVASTRVSPGETSRRRSESVAPEVEPDQEAVRAFPWLPVAFSVLMLLVAGGYYLKKKKQG